MNEEQDKQKIRDLIGKWIEATRAGDVETVLGLMAPDVVFLMPGQEPMRGRETFAAGSRANAGKMKFEIRPEIREIQIAGDYAFGWIHLSISMTPLPNGPAKRLAGNILSVYRKEPDGRWVLYRDANMMTPVA